MKYLWALTFVAILPWCSPVSAEYCSVKSEGKEISCIYKIDHIPKNTQIVISYTRQGWSMMIAVFRKEFAIIEGDSKVEIKKHEMQSIEHISTQRDITYNGMMMESPVYMVTEELLHELGNASGKIRFWLSASETKGKPVEVEVAASVFSDIDDYIKETRSVLGVLFEDEKE